jgi:hypothetical protein
MHQEVIHARLFAVINYICQMSKNFYYVLWFLLATMESCSGNSIPNKGHIQYNSQELELSQDSFNSFQYTEVKSFLLEHRVDIAKLFNYNQTFRITPDGCYSYYADSNSIVKNCNGNITKRYIFTKGTSYLLSNYKWVSQSHLVLTYHVPGMGYTNDWTVYLYDFDSGKIASTYNFDGSDMLHSKLPNFNNSINNGSSSHYDFSGSTTFDLIFNHKDSSIILPVYPAYNKTNPKDTFTFQHLSNTKVLLKVFPIHANKTAYRLLPEFKDLFFDCNKSKYFYQSLYNVSSYHDESKNTLYLSTGLSNMIIQYDYLNNEQKVVNNSHEFLPNCNGFDSLSNSNDFSQSFFLNLFYDSIHNLFLRQVLLPLNDKELKKHWPKRYGCIVMDNKFKTLGFVEFPIGYKMFGLDKQGYLHLKQTENISDFTSSQILVISIAKTFSRKASVGLVSEPPSLEKEYSNYNSFFKDVNPDILNYKKVVIVPIDNSCPACINKVTNFLTIADSIQSDVCVIILFKNKSKAEELASILRNKSFNNQIVFDKNLNHSRLSYTPSSLQYIVLQEKEYILKQDFNPETISEFFSLLAVDLLDIIGPTCNDIGE